MGSLCGEYVFMGPSETSLKTCHGANYLHEPPSGPAFRIRDANVFRGQLSWMTSSFLEMGLTHHGVRLGLVLHFLKSVWHSNGYEVDEFILS